MKKKLDEKKIFSILDELVEKVNESRANGDYRWVRSYKFDEKVFDVGKKYRGLDFTKEITDFLFGPPKKNSVFLTPKFKKSQTYNYAVNLTSDMVEIMLKMKNSQKLKKNPEWAAIRGHEIDDYLLNGCPRNQFSSTLKFLNPPTVETPWIKNLISLQMLGSVGTWDEIKGMSGDPIGPWGQDRLRSILHCGFIEIVKKGKYGKRIFGLTEKGEKAIEYAVSH